MAVSMDQVWVAVINTTPKDKLPAWYDRKFAAQARPWMVKSPKSATKVLEGYCLADGIIDVAQIKAESEADWDRIVENFWKELFRWMESFDLIPRGYYESNKE